MIVGFEGPLADRLAIRERIEAYNDAVFRRDADAWAECWALDATWAVAGREAEGREAIRTLWLELMAGYEAVGMYVNHGAVAVDGDVATARSYMFEMMKQVDGTGLLVSGRYDDRLRRDADGAWRFTSRAYTVLQLR
ncbi:YybH family protein [Thermaurantiacus sp.]